MDAEFDFAPLSAVTFAALSTPGQLLSFTGPFDILMTPPSGPMTVPPGNEPPLLLLLPPLLLEVQAPKPMQVPLSSPFPPLLLPALVSIPLPFEPQLAHQTTATSVTMKPALVTARFCWL